MNHIRLEDEDLNAYALRLYENKSEYGLNSESIAELLNKETGKSFGESAWRKRFKAFKQGMEYQKGLNISNSDELAKLEEKRREIIAERDRLSIVRKEYTTAIKKKSRQELFYENIGNTIQTLEVPELYAQYTNANPKRGYVLTIADIHAGSCFDIGKNSYSFNICTERFKNLLNKTISFIKDRNIEHMNVLCLSDTVQGILRKSDLKLNESSVVEATVFVSKTIANFLNKLSEYVVVDYYHCPTGNHTQVRNLGSDRNELKDEDVEFIIGNYIKDVLVNNNNVYVHTNYDKDYIEFDVLGHNVVAMHGHTISNVNSAIKDISFHNRKFYDVLFLAHYHGGQSAVNGTTVDHDIETIVVPSFIGTCPYSDSLMKSSEPACMIYTFESGNGITQTNKILLKNSEYRW